MTMPTNDQHFGQWNNQNWKIEYTGTRSTKTGGLDGVLIIPMWNGTKTKQVKIKW